MLKLATRRAALWSYLGSVVILFLIVGAALVYWMARGPSSATRDSADENVTEAIGTAGNTTPGGFDPQPRPGNTSDELKHRGAGETPQGPNPGLAGIDPLTTMHAVASVTAKNAVGQRVELRDVEVESAEGDVMRVREGTTSIAVIMPRNAATPRTGDHIDLSGSLQPDDQGHVRILGSRIDVKRH